jgi:hypothetical protein
MRRTIGFGFLFVVLMYIQMAAAQVNSTESFKEHDEELSGVVSMVYPQENLLIVEKNSIPYNFRITADTRITVGMRMWAANLEDLEARKGQWATVKFRVTRDGNMAKEVAVRRGPPFFSRMEGSGSSSAMPWRCPMFGGPS